MKEFLTYDKQYELLATRCLRIDDKQFAIDVLKNEGYYNLINGYSKFFQYPDSDVYMKDVTFNHVVALYAFDQELRNILYKFTSIIECHIKAMIGHEFSRLHGIDHNVYLAPTCFTTDKRHKQSIEALIKNCQDAITEGANENSNRRKEYIVHYLDKHKEIPLWVLARALSFGVISKFYSLMQNQEKYAVANEFGLVPSQFSNILKIVVMFRNKVAHGERTFCVHTKETLSNLNVLKKLSLPKNETGDIKCGKRDLLALLICCKYLLSDTNFENLIADIKKALTNLASQINKNTMARVLNEMGLKSLYRNLDSLVKIKK